MKEGMRKDKKLKLKLKLTKGITKASMSERDKLHKKATKKKDSQSKINKHETYKKIYQKLVNRLTIKIF